MADDTESKLIQEQLDKLAASAVNDENQTLFGFIPLPGPLLTIADIFLPRAIREFKGVAADRITDAVTKTAKSLGASNPEKIGHYSGQGFVQLLPYLGNIGDVYGTIKTHKQNTAWLHQEVATLTAANRSAHGGSVVGKITGRLHGASGNGNNKMLSYANAIIRKGTKDNLTRNAMNAVPSILLSVDSRFGDKYQQAIKNPGLGVESAEAKNYAQKKKVIGWVVDSSGLITAAAKKMVQFKDPEKAIGATSLGKVLEIQEYMRTNEIGCAKYDPTTTDEKKVTQLIVDAFQKFQKEQGHPALPTRPLQETAELLANYLVNGDMHALSLINIIGKEELLDSQKSSFVSKENIEEVIAREMQVLSKSSSVNVEKFMNDRDYTLDDVKAHLRSSDTEERTMTTLLHPDSVLKAAGLKQNDINSMRDNLTVSLVENMFVVVIDDLDQRKDSQLKDMGYSPDDIRFIRKAAGNPDHVIEALGSLRGGTKVKNIVSNAVMGEEANGEYWQELVTKSKEMPDIESTTTEKKADKETAIDDNEENDLPDDRERHHRESGKHASEHRRKRDTDRDHEGASL